MSTKDLTAIKWLLDLHNTWISFWGAGRQEIAKEVEPLIVPLRLLNVGIAYLATQKETALLDLPLEERRIVREALGLEEA